MASYLQRTGLSQGHRPKARGQGRAVIRAWNSQFQSQAHQVVPEDDERRPSQHPPQGFLCPLNSHRSPSSHWAAQVSALAADQVPTSSQTLHSS